MEERERILFDALSEKQLYTKTYEEFVTQFSNEESRRKLHEALYAKQLYTKSYEDFDSQFFTVKKKEPSFLDYLESGQKYTADSTEQPRSLDESLIPQQPLPIKKRDTGSYAGDILERIGAGIIDLATSTPKKLKFAQKLMNIPKDIAKKELSILGLSEETAEKIASNIPFIKPEGIDAGIKLSSAVWDKIGDTEGFKETQKKANELRDASARYDKLFSEYFKNKEYGKALGTAILSGAESLPITIEAAFGGPAGLLDVGYYAASMQYDQLAANADMTEVQKISNALANGAFEILTEKLGSANYGKLLKKLYKIVGKEQAEVAVKGALKSWLSKMWKRFGIYTAPVGESIEEGINQFAGNLTARVTGEDVDRPLDYGVLDAMGGGFGGGTFFVGPGMFAQARAQYYEAKLKQKEKLDKEQAKAKEPSKTTDKGTVTTEVGALEVPEAVRKQFEEDNLSLNKDELKEMKDAEKKTVEEPIEVTEEPTVPAEPTPPKAEIPTIESLNKRAIDYGLVKTEQGKDVVNVILGTDELYRAGEEVTKRTIDKIPKEEWDRLVQDATDIKEGKVVEPTMEEAIAEPRDDKVYFRGQTPEGKGKIATGNAEWDNNLFVSKSKESALNYGEVITEFRPKKTAKILEEGTPEFNKVIKFKHKVGESLLDYATKVIKKAKELGYDIVEFKRQGDVGTVVMNKDSVIETAPAKVEEVPTEVKEEVKPVFKSNKEIGDAFSNVLNSLGRSRLEGVLDNWNESRLSPDGDKIISNPFRRNAPKGKGSTITTGKKGFIEWLLSDEPFNEKVYGENISKDEEWVKDINDAREAIGYKQGPQELSPTKPTEKPAKESNIYNKQQVIESLLSEYPEEVREQVRNSFARAENFDEMAAQAGFNSLGGGQYTRESVAKVQEDVVQKEPVFTELEHKTNIEQKFRDTFKKKGVSDEQINGALALMQARAKSWASEQEGRTPEQWYQRIADIKEGEFQEGATPKLYQLPDGRQVMGMALPEVTNGFYSPIEKRLLDFKQEKASVNKWKEIIGKGDEATFTGVMDWLNSLKPDQSLAKTEINQFMKDNRIEVVEVVKDQDANRIYTDEWYSTREKLIKQGFDVTVDADNNLFIETPEGEELTNLNDVLASSFPSVQNNSYDLETLFNIFAKGTEVDTKFSQYQLPGEKSNYKEVLVTMPSNARQSQKYVDAYSESVDAVEEAMKPLTAKAQEMFGSIWHNLDDKQKISVQLEIPKEYNRYRDAVAKMGQARQELEKNKEIQFRSSHFDEPNILVHLRMNTRTDSEGNKVLFLEEIQSDWGEQGRQKGFNRKWTQDEVAREFHNKPYSELDDASKSEVDWELQGRNEGTGGASQRLTGNIPSAPFVTDTNAWVKLGLKTALKEAIKQGVDRIAWTTGEQQNERYDLSKQVDEIKWEIVSTKEVNGKENIYNIIPVKDGLDYGGEGAIRNFVESLSNVPESKLPDIIGKEATDKIISTRPAPNTSTSPNKQPRFGVLRGNDLKVGGKGMIGFYGSPQESKLGIVGNIAKSLFKQEPKTTKMQTESGIFANKDVLRNGIGLTYEEARNFNFAGEDLLYAVNEKTQEVRMLNNYRALTEMSPNEIPVMITPKYYNKQHSIDITPALKQEVQKGLPLFQKGKGKPKGAVETLADGKVIIHALSRPDFSTMVHEIVHVFEKDLSGDEIATIEKWSGKKRRTREFSEAFARGGERYLRDGKSPTKELIPIFEKFKQWLTDIYKTLKGSPIEKKLSPEVRKIFNRLLTEQKPTEPISKPVEPLSTQESIPAPPKVEEVAEVKEKGEEKYRKTQTNALIQDKTLQQQEIAKIVDANKEKYIVLHQADAVEQAKDFIDKQGVENATVELKEATRKMADFPMRQVARQVLLDFYSRAIIDPNAKEADKKKAFRTIDDLQSITAREATKAGQGNALLQVWKSMQPSGLLEYVARKIATSNQKTLDKKIGDSTLGEQLDALYETLNEESKKIILDILAGKPVSMPKQEERPIKEAPKRKTVPKERIKKEQEYRKNLLDQYRKSEKPMAMAVTGLTSSQIELGGNLVASYVREGYYRMQDIVDRLIKDLKSVDIDADEKNINDIFKQPKTDKETLGEYIDKVESKARTRSAEKNINKRISDVITEHWSVKDELKRTLAQKLVDEAGLTEEEANRLEKEILDKFDKEIISRSEKQLTKLLGTTKLPQEKKAKNIVGKMVELINMGALDEDLYRDLFAEKFNLVKLTDVHKEEILKLANNVQLASGKGWLERDATIRLAKYIFELYPESRSGEVFDTWISMAYANMLAGPTTSILNMWSAGWNMSTKPIRDLSNLSKWLRLVKDATKGEGDIYNPFGEMFYSPMLRGSQAGLEQAQEVYRNGDLNNKYVEDVAKKNQFKVTQLERDKYGKSKRFKPVNVKIGNKTIDLNLFNAYKYSGRNLSAQDKFMLTTSYEVELAHILRDKLKNRDLKGKALTHEVMSILRGDHIDMEELNANLESEALLYHQMTGEWMTDLQKKIRKREMMLDQLPLTPEEKEEAERLARSNIFTDDRFGVIATMANAIGAAANKSYTAGLIIKPFIPFTKVVGNVAEYMLDHVPFYGFMRANGKSISYIKRLIDSEAQTAQMGERGSRAYYEQMGRAWLGTMSFIVMGMLFLGRDDEDFMEVSGGYLQEGFKKKGRENVLPPYTLRIGNVKIPYKNIPALAIPLALIGNVNDALKSKQDEGEVMDRFTVALFLEACQNTVFMFKDMSFLDGAQRLAQIASDIASTDEKKWTDISENAIKSYLGFATRPLPQNNNAVQQIWKFFDPESYPQNDIKGTLMYAAGVQHFSKYTAIDQLGDAVTSYPGETLMPYTHWFKIKGEDERWKFLAKYNAIPNKIYNRVMQIDTPTGVEKRKLEEDELYEYSKRSGDLFSKKVIKYMSDKEKVAKRGSEIIEREKSNGEIEKINGIREDVEKLWGDAKKQSETELFKWSLFKEKFPKKWEILKDNQALQMPQSSMRDIFMGEEAEKLKFNEEDIAKFNTRAMELYSDMVIPTIQAMDSESRKRKLPTGETEYDYIINSLWTAAKQQAKAEIVEEKMATKK